MTVDALNPRRVRVHADLDGAIEALQSLAAHARGQPELFSHLVHDLESGPCLFVAEVHDCAALGTGELRVVYKPTKEFSGLVSALARDV